MKFLSSNLKLAILSVSILFVAHMQAHAGPKETLIVAGGCFWCVESDFESVPGVVSAVSGYTGGAKANPSYKEVSRGGSGHYEAVEITFDTAKVTRKHLLELFIRSVDATDAGGQFCDRGESYRTAIFVSNPAEHALAKSVLDDAQRALGQKIVTPVLEAKPFYNAEARHQDYYKGTRRVATRFGFVRQSKAYEKYRLGCGRDARVTELWGDAAPFAKDH